MRHAVRAMIGAAKRNNNLAERQEIHREIAWLIEAALRHDQLQTWMYEGLALAWVSSGAPASFVDERMLAVAERNSGEPEVLFHIATVLSRLNHNAAAIQLFQDAATLDPSMREAYLTVIVLAAQQNDADAIQWVLTSLVSELSDQEPLVRYARRMASLIAERLRRRGQQKEADSLSDAIARVDQTDLQVRIWWSGNADIDLIVMDPSEKLCSWQQPYSESGGMHLGDGFGPEKTETYVGKQIFSGRYVIRIRHVWGSPVAKRVKLEIIRHAGTSYQKREVSSVQLTEEDIVIPLELSQGRRTRLAQVPDMAPNGSDNENPLSGNQPGGEARPLANRMPTVPGGSGPSYGYDSSQWDLYFNTFPVLMEMNRLFPSIPARAVDVRRPSPFGF